MQIKPFYYQTDCKTQPQSSLELSVFYAINHQIDADLCSCYFRDMFCAGRVQEDDLLRTMKACGGAIQTSVNSMTDDVLGRCEMFEENQVGGERLVSFPLISLPLHCVLLTNNIICFVAHIVLLSCI